MPNTSTFAEIAARIRTFKLLQAGSSYNIYPSDSKGIVGGWSGNDKNMQNKVAFDATSFSLLSVYIWIGTNTMSSVYTDLTVKILNANGGVITSGYKRITSNRDDGFYYININISSIKQKVFIQTLYSSNTPYGSDCNARVISMILNT